MTSVTIETKITAKMIFTNPPMIITTGKIFVFREEITIARNSRVKHDDIIRSIADNKSSTNSN